MAEINHSADAATAAADAATADGGDAITAEPLHGDTVRYLMGALGSIALEGLFSKSNYVMQVSQSPSHLNTHTPAYSYVLYMCPSVCQCSSICLRNLLGIDAGLLGRGWFRFCWPHSLETQ